MAWAERVYGDKPPPRSTPTSVSEERQELFGADTKVPGEVPLPEIPPMFKAEPAVLEAQLIVQGKSTKRGITDGRVIH